ncbi:MAG TPA: LPS-assembly protein LptD [Anaeromyxobacteraceae bacterium]|nr:LPS-assembly protein LptD [Anaeromyxobacteraceae bacterium]
MIHALALAAAGVLLGAPSPERQPLPGAGPLQVEVAGPVTCTAATGRCRAEGGVVLRRGAITLRARTAEYDPATGEVHAAGDVLLTDATRVVAADGIHAVMGGEFQAEDVVAFVKDVPQKLADAATLEAARRTGRNRLSFSGTRVTGTTGHFLVEKARLTLCDCPGGGAPSWEIRASKADVLPGDRAILTNPVLYVTPRFLFIDEPVPILPLPWLYVPLSDRQTGLLVPTFTSTGTSGLILAQSVFVTLGRSADATVTPKYAFGPSSTSGGAVRGPGADLELRWAPAVGSQGRVDVAWLYDLDREAGGEYGSRLAVSGAHVQRAFEGATLRVDLSLFGDPIYLHDFNADVLQRDTFYRRSGAILSWRGGPAVLEASAAYYEPLSYGGQLLQVPFGAFGARVPAFQRWPALTATLLPTALAGPLTLSARAGLARFAPPAGNTNGADTGLVCPAPPCPETGLGPGDREWNAPPPAVVTPLAEEDPRQRLAATRADLRAEVSAPLLLGGAVSLTPYLRGAATGYAFDAGSDPMANAWAVGGARLEAEISRDYGELRHAIAPRLQWSLGSAVAGRALPTWGYDAWDRPPTSATLVEESFTGETIPGSVPTGRRVLAAAPPGAYDQLRASVETRLSRGAADLGRLEIGQDLDAAAGRLAETWVSAGAAAGPFSLDALARFWAFQDRPYALVPTVGRSWLDRFSELRVGATARDRRGDAVRGALLAIGEGASPDLLSGPDALFEVRPAPFAAVGQWTAGATAVLGAATLGYDALVTARPTILGACNASGQLREVSSGHLQQQHATLSWNSPCRCFRAAVTVGYNDCGTFSYSFVLDLSRLGGTTP